MMAVMSLELLYCAGQALQKVSLPEMDVGIPRLLADHLGSGSSILIYTVLHEQCLENNSWSGSDWCHWTHQQQVFRLMYAL